MVTKLVIMPHALRVSYILAKNHMVTKLTSDSIS